jgi:hypothetical protein
MNTPALPSKPHVKVRGATTPTQAIHVRAESKTEARVKIQTRYKHDKL